MSRHRQASPNSSWQPKSLAILRGYSMGRFSADVVAGVTVGLVALPLAMAFAISSGAPPQAGLYCAVVAGFAISALGGSRTQIGGPTGAFVVVVSGIIAQHGFDGLLLCTMMAGAALVLLGLTGLGSAVRFIPRPVVIGFTNGIALLIASTQLRDFFGLRMDGVPGDFLGRMRALAYSAGTLSIAATALAAAAVAIVVLCSRYIRRVPGPIVALVLGTATAVVFALPVETIGTRFGGIPAGLPTFSWPKWQGHDLMALLSPAMTVAMLGAIESLMSAVVADRLTGDKHNPNVELVAQGVANLAAPLFGGLPATGAIARTATNVRSGATSPVAGMVHALTLLAVLLFAAPLVKFVPLAVLAGILLVVAYNMGEWREIPKVLTLSWADISVWAVTLALTVLADLTIAVELGMVLAALLFIRNVALTSTISKVTAAAVDEGRSHAIEQHEIPSYVDVFRIEGPFLFGVTDKLWDSVGDIELLQPIVIVRLRDMTALDATGLLTLEDLAHRLHDAGRQLIVCGARQQPAKLLRKAHFGPRVIGAQNVCANISAALERAGQLRAAESTELAATA